jgi:shikimate dehydrogenase
MPDMPEDGLQDEPTKVYGLIGYPLSHSFSEKYFSEKFKKENIKNCRYELFPLRSVDELKQLLRSYPAIRGLNVTVPYKQQVLRYLNSVAHIPEGIRACNCIKVERKKLTGYNTDCIGFEKSLIPVLQPHHTKALVLGSGGAAEAVTYVLKKLGIDIAVVSRTPRRAAILTYYEINEKKIKDYTLIINCTPLGMFPDSDNCPDIPYQSLTKNHLLYDLIYNPAKSLFLKKGEAMGATIKNGEEMLIIQAEESWKIWNS